MTNRIVATSKFLSLSIVGLQFIAGIRYVAGLFESDATVRKMWESIVETFGQMHAVFSSQTNAPNQSGPPGALLLVLGFLCFGYALFALVPGAVAKTGKRESLVIGDW